VGGEVGEEGVLHQLGLQGLGLQGSLSLLGEEGLLG